MPEEPKFVILDHKPSETAFMIQGDTGKMTANWTVITEHAKTPFPKPPEAHHLYRFFEMRFHSITHCRMALSARHEGWIEAGGKPEDNPFPPVASNPNDFKIDFDWNKWING